MKLLLTGVTGFIGRHLTKRLLGDGCKVCVIIRNKENKAKLEESHIKCFVDDNSNEWLFDLFKREKFDGVIHLASCFIVEHKMEDVHNLINSNVLFAARILEASSRTRVNWFINTGTLWQHYENRDYSPVNLYAATKQAFEVIARFYIEAYPLNFVTLQLSDTYGREDPRPKILNLWSKIADTKEMLPMSAGRQLIDMVYIDDVVSAYVKMIRLLEKDAARRFNGKIFSVSSGNPISLRELAGLFSQTTDKNLNIKWAARPYRKREVMVPWNKGRRVPGWTPRVSLEEGIARTYMQTQGQ